MCPVATLVAQALPSQGRVAEGRERAAQRNTSNGDGVNSLPHSTIIE